MDFLYYYSWNMYGGRYFQLANSKQQAYNHARKIAQDARFSAPIEIWQKVPGGELSKIEIIKQ